MPDMARLSRLPDDLATVMVMGGAPPPCRERMPAPVHVVSVELNTPTCSCPSGAFTSMTRPLADVSVEPGRMETSSESCVMRAAQGVETLNDWPARLMAPRSASAKGGRTASSGPAAALATTVRCWVVRSACVMVAPPSMTLSAWASTCSLPVTST